MHFLFHSFVASHVVLFRVVYHAVNLSAAVGTGCFRTCFTHLATSASYTLSLCCTPPSVHMPRSILKHARSSIDIRPPQKTVTFSDDTKVPARLNRTEEEREYLLARIDWLLDRINGVLEGPNVHRKAWYWANDFNNDFPQYY